jgi:periplasmic protein TonB
MRLALSFLGACAVALALFALMLYMVAPPSSQPSDEPVTVANFVRLDGESSQAATRSRQQAPQPPQAPPTQAPPAPTPLAAAPSATLPTLDLPLPNLSSALSVASAPTPSLSGLAAAAASAAPPGAAAGSESAGQPGAVESEVMPLNDVSPDYPRYALQRGIQGHVKLAFTINRAGAVENLRVLEASPANVFEREARRAAVRWRFAPRTENGLAVAREAVKTLYFRLEEGS